MHTVVAHPLDNPMTTCPQTKDVAEQRWPANLDGNSRASALAAAGSCDLLGGGDSRCHTDPWELKYLS